MSTTAVEKGLQFEKAIVDMLKAGYDLWTNQDIEGYLEVGKSDAERGDYFLRVVGDSMVGSHIYEDDLVFVQQCNSVNSGDIAIVMIDEEVTIKKVYFKNDNLILVASNFKYEDRYFDQEEIERQNIQIIGKVLFVRRDFLMPQNN
ncbi:MAG: S24 family peptidase [Bacillota bacterium]|nr:S24 family peptidase [Bacillota bacterium]